MRPQIGRRAGDLVELGLQPVNHLLGRFPAFGQRLQYHEGRPGAATAVEPRDLCYSRVLPDDLDELRQLLSHQLKRDALVGLDAAPDQPIVLLRQIPLWNIDEELDGKHNVTSKLSMMKLGHCNAQRNERS